MGLDNKVKNEESFEEERFAQELSDRIIRNYRRLDEENNCRRIMAEALLKEGKTLEEVVEIVKLPIEIVKKVQSNLPRENKKEKKFVRDFKKLLMDDAPLFDMLKLLELNKEEIALFMLKVENSDYYIARGSYDRQIASFETEWDIVYDNGVIKAHKKMNNDINEDDVEINKTIKRYALLRTLSGIGIEKSRIMWYFGYSLKELNEILG